MSCAAAEYQQPQRFAVENQVKRIVILLHRYLGLLAALFALLLGLSGSLLAVQQLLQGETYPAPVASHAPSPHYQVVLASLRASYPQADFTLRLPQNPADAIEVRVRQRQQPDQLLWLDPQFGRPLATPEGRGTGWRWLHEVHARLLLEDGKTWVGVAGIAILLVLLSGIIHWWPKDWRKAWRLRRDKGLAVWLGDLHRMLGASMLLLLLLSTLSGLVLAFNQPIRQWLSPAKHGQPRTGKHITPAGPQLALDELVARGNARLPQGRLSSISISARANQPVELRKRLDDELHPNGSTLIRLDPYRGTVLSVERTEQTQAWRKIGSWAQALHTGSLGGAWHQLLMAVSGVVLMILGGSGLFQWQARRRKQGSRQAAMVATRARTAQQ